MAPSTLLLLMCPCAGLAACLTECWMMQALRSSSRSLDAALLRGLGSRRMSRTGSEGDVLPEALTKPPAGKDNSEQNREEMREKLRIVKASTCVVIFRLHSALLLGLQVCMWSP